MDSPTLTEEVEISSTDKNNTPDETSKKEIAHPPHLIDGLKTADRNSDPSKSPNADVEMDSNADTHDSETLRPKDSEQPGHSRSYGGSCDSTSGVGSNGSNSSSSSSTAISSSIKKRSNSSHRRNYRTSHPQVDSDNSNDYNSVINKSKSYEAAAELADNDSSSSSNDDDLPLNKYMKSENPNRRAPADDNYDSSDTRDTADHHDHSDQRSSTSTPLALAFSGSNDENDDDDESPGSQEHSPTRGPFEGFFNVYHRDSSGSDSSLFGPEVEEESSSSSSDNYLEDIDEQPAESPRPTPDADDRGSSTAETRKEKPTSETNKSKTKPKIKAELPPVLKKKKPVGDWCGPKELFHRELGLRGKKQPQASDLFRSKFYGSVFSAERLELMKKLDGHNGCVNCLNFNHSGTKLATGSDDLLIKIWNYSTGQCLKSFSSGHKANVFQAKFLPLIGLDTIIISCARDSQVRLTELNSSGEVCSNKKLFQHHGPAHKLSISPDTPHVVLSCGEDGLVYSIDIREEKPERLLKVTEKGKRISLYSIHQNPLSPHEFCVSGRDQYMRIYDTRRLGRNSVNLLSDDEGTSGNSASTNDDLPLKKFCPHHLMESTVKTNVTAAVYNYNGKEILGSYNDENIYLFDATHSDLADCIKVYEGHRNNDTVKGVNFFGDRSQFVISGSDCGHLFIWHKETESIVNFQRGDETGVVNCLEGHPTAPILATSGLDNDIKIWIPSNEKPPQMGDLGSTVRRNLKRREDDRKNQPQFDQHVMWALWNQIRRSERVRDRAEGGDPGGGDDSDTPHLWSDEDDDDDDDDDDDAPARGVDCTII